MWLKVYKFFKIFLFGFRFTWCSGELTERDNKRAERCFLVTFLCLAKISLGVCTFHISVFDLIQRQKMRILLKRLKYKASWNFIFMRGFARAAQPSHCHRYLEKDIGTTCQQISIDGKSIHSWRVQECRYCVEGIYIGGAASLITADDYNADRIRSLPRPFLFRAVPMWINGAAADPGAGLSDLRARIFEYPRATEFD